MGKTAPIVGKRIAFQGVAGANSEAVIWQHFGPSTATNPIETLPMETFDDIFRAVESGAATHGMLPVEN